MSQIQVLVTFDDTWNEEEALAVFDPSTLNVQGIVSVELIKKHCGKCLVEPKTYPCEETTGVKKECSTCYKSHYSGDSSCNYQMDECSFPLYRHWKPSEFIKIK